MIVVKIIGIEGSIPIDEVARRVTPAFDKSRAGNRIVEDGVDMFRSSST
ncbi:MAG: DUF3320 domain-containing protein [Mesorhizobium sp.]|nr:MAG: DUF3320 domain-containing protein [Mesorhizobium sp.]